MDASQMTDTYTYVIDIDVTRETARNLGLTQQPGRMEIIDDNSKVNGRNNEDSNAEVTQSKPRIVIVGAGPAGLFCALSLASSGLCTPILLELSLIHISEPTRH